MGMGTAGDRATVERINQLICKPFEVSLSNHLCVIPAKAGTQRLA